MRIDNPAAGTAAGAAPLMMSGPWTTGRYYWLPPSSAGSNVTLAKDTERAIAFYVPNAVTLTRLGVQVTSAGDVGSKIRFGIRNDDGTGRPGTLLIDAGVVAADATGAIQTSAFSQALLANTLYWVTATPQIITVTAPQVTCISGPAVYNDGGATAPSASANAYGREQASITGALPNSWTDNGVTPNMYRIYGKV